MNHDLLKTIIFDQHEVIRNARIVPREHFFETNANYILVGPRRAGKSTLLYSMARKLFENGVGWERIIYINFEDERLMEFSSADFNDILAVQAELSPLEGFFFFDEIQNVAGWEKFARRLADSGKRVCITGSNAKMLSVEMEAALGGRYMSRLVYPYSFAEYLDAKGTRRDASALRSTSGLGRISASVGEYLHTGGFPESLNYENKREYLSSILSKVLLGDLVARNGLRNDAAVRLLIKKISETVCSEVSYSRLCGMVKAVGVNTTKDSVISYIQYAMDAYLLFTAQNHFAEFSERESTPRYYFTDNGLLGLFLWDKDTALLENLVAIHLKRKYGEVRFLKSQRHGIDVDFYIPETGLAIQVAYRLSTEAREREISALTRLARHFPSAKNFVVVTMDEQDSLDLEGLHIPVIPVGKFLLE